MAQLLRDDGHEVEACTSGADAVDALARGSYDVVLTDLNMPGTNGVHVVRAARANQGPVCVVVATAEAADRTAELVASGACIVIDKPLDLADTTSTLARCHAEGGPCVHGLCPLRRSR